jgi:hypothetical protein
LAFRLGGSRGRVAECSSNLQLDAEEATRAVLLGLGGVSPSLPAILDVQIHIHKFRAAECFGESEQPAAQYPVIDTTTQKLRRCRDVCEITDEVPNKVANCPLEWQYLEGMLKSFSHGYAERNGNPLILKRSHNW